MDKLLDAVRDTARRLMFQVARGLNRLTFGRLHPNTVTIVGLLAHLPIAYLVANDRLVLAGGLLIFFGLFDALDGALARVQKRTSNRGMFLDSVSDRLKEVMLYIGIVYLFVGDDRFGAAVWAVTALGLSVTVSYVNAWGEAVIGKQATATDHQQNKTFRSGLMTYDVRIALIIIGLLFAILEYSVAIIAVLSFITVLQRTALVLKKLS